MNVLTWRKPTSTDRYVLSFDLWGERRSVRLPLSDRFARWFGRHLWRLGARRWQLEQGRDPTSYVPTKDGPVTRHADILEVGRCENGEDCDGRHVARIGGTGGHIFFWYGDALHDGDPPDTPHPVFRVIMEPQRTNLALWSDGRPKEIR